MINVIVLYSGGLDSRLVVNILKKQGINVLAVYFHLPFGCTCQKISSEREFLEGLGVKFKVFDCSKEPLLSEYLHVLKNPKHGRGKGYNPCTDCKIFMLKKVKEYADKNHIEIIATGEVLGQRPMSQTKRRKILIDSEIDFEVLRPLSAKILAETVYEKKGLVDRSRFYDFVGRGRRKQMELAKSFEINYPTPSGGCLLCEKAYKKRFKVLLENNLINEKTLVLVSFGRHFLINGEWFIVARDEKDCIVLDKYKETLIGKKGIPSVYASLNNKELAKRLQIVFSKGPEKEQRRLYEKWKL